jgi:uncharacterized protein (DUF433 family)
MEFIGKGTYTLSEIHHLTGIPSKNISRWTKGYTSIKNNIDYPHNPVYKKDFSSEYSEQFYSFLDLVEILFINSFEQHGISLQSIRKAADCAAKILKTSHPFAKRVFYTDGKTILARIAEKNNDPDLIDLLKKQYQIEPIISPLLYESLDFNHLELAEKWWPLGKQNRIVVDPKRNFGKPIIDNLNIRVDTIIDLINRKRSIKEISEWYNIDELSIHAAVNFNKKAIA